MNFISPKLQCTLGPTNCLARTPRDFAPAPNSHEVSEENYFRLIFTEKFFKIKISNFDHFG